MHGHISPVNTVVTQCLRTQPALIPGLQGTCISLHHAVLPWCLPSSKQQWQSTTDGNLQSSESKSNCSSLEAGFLRRFVTVGGGNKNKYWISNYSPMLTSWTCLGSQPAEILENNYLLFKHPFFHPRTYWIFVWYQTRTETAQSLQLAFKIAYLSIWRETNRLVFEVTNTFES